MRVRPSSTAPSPKLTALAAILIAGCAPAAPPPEPPKPAPVAKPTPPPPPTAARWTFHEGVLFPHAQLALAQKGEVLQVGDQGRRWTLADGKATFADTVAVGTLVDVRSDDGKFAFLGTDGALYASDTPLGALQRRAEGPSEKARAFCFGKKALLGVTDDGLLLRAADPTAKWASSPLPTKPGEKAVAIASDRKGRVLVLLAPQRLLLSSDDGATFAQVALSGIGAEALLRDAADDLFVRGGFSLVAKLDGQKLVNGGTPAPLAKQTLDKEEGYSTTHLAGDRVAVLTTSYKGGKRKTEVAFGGIGDKLGDRHVLVDGANSEIQIDGHGSFVVMALEDYDADPYVRVFTTSDDGKTITPAGSFEGRPDWPFRVYAGPKGWVYLSGLCEDSGPCNAPQVRIGGAWKPLSKKLRPEAFTIDEKNERAYFFDRDSHKLWSLGLSDTTPVEVGVDIGTEAPLAMTVDETGTLRIVHGRPLRLTRVAATGGAQPPLYLPFEAYSMALFGLRGLAPAVGGGGYETMDGGEHWVKVAVAGYGQIDCVKTGCLAGRAVRVGWDLPALGGESLPSTEEPKVKKVVAPMPLPPPETQVKLDCTYEEKWTKLGSGYPHPGDLRSGPGDVRWVDFPYGAYGKDQMVIVARAGQTPKAIKLLDAPKASGEKTTRPGRISSPTGVVAAHYTFGPKKDGAYSPVDVELGFYDNASGKSGKAKIPGVKPFRVGRSSVSAAIDVVEGGVIFVPENDESPIYFAKLDGKVESFPRPPKGPGGGRWRNAVKVGKQVALTSMGWSSLEIAYTKDLGKTWTTTVWSLGGGAQLTVEAGVPVLRTQRTGGFSFPLDALGPDLPAGKSIVTVPAAPLAACDAKGFAGPMSSDSLGKALLVHASPKPKGKAPATGPSLELRGASRLTFSADGKACAGGLWAATASGEMWDAVIAPHDLGHGYLIKQEKGELVSAPLSCKAQ